MEQIAPIIPEVLETTPTTPVSSALSTKKTSPILIIFILIGVIAAIVFTAASPFQVMGNSPVYPNKTTVLGERLSYWFRSPKQNEIVVFTICQEASQSEICTLPMDAIGIIRRISTTDSLSTYSIQTTTSGKTWTVSKDRIHHHIYWPFPQETISEVTPNPSPTQNYSSDWKMYQNQSFGFSVQYPNSAVIQNELDDENNRTVSIVGGDIDLSITLKATNPSFTLDSYYFMDNPTFTSTTLAGQKANIYTFPQGYCDGPSCSKPYIAVVTEHSNNIYSLSFFGDDQLSDTENQILSTFKFTN